MNASDTSRVGDIICIGICFVFAMYKPFYIPKRKLNLPLNKILRAGEQLEFGTTMILII